MEQADINEQIGWPEDYLQAVRERNNWFETALQNQRNEDYYRDLLDEVAKYLGPEVFIADDGTVSNSPLRAKIPELVRKMTDKYREEEEYRAMQDALRNIRIAVRDFRLDIESIYPSKNFGPISVCPHVPVVITTTIPEDTTKCSGVMLIQNENLPINVESIYSHPINKE